MLDHIIETFACSTFGRILGLSIVTREDNLYDLGGDSLLAARIAIAAQKQYGVTISLVRFIQQPTPYHLATLIADSLTVGSHHASTPVAHPVLAATG